MSFNLVELVEDSFSNDAIDNIGLAIAASEDQVKAGIDIGSPYLLHTLSKISKNTMGAEALSRSLKIQDESVIEDLAEHFSGVKSKMFANNGINTLNSLLGADGANELVIDIAAQTGMNQRSAHSFLGLLMPVVISVIKLKSRELGGVGSTALVEMLDGQTENIAKAMPQDSYVPLTGKEAPAQMLNNEPVMEQVKQDTLFIDESALLAQKQGQFSHGKTILIVLLPIMLFLGYVWFFSGSDKQSMQLPDLPDEVSSFMMDKSTDSPDLTVIPDYPNQESLASVLNNIANLLKDIKDVETAKAIIPELDAEALRMKTIADEMNKQPETIRLQATETIQQMLPELQSIVDSIYEIPQVKAIIEPAMDNIIEKMAQLH